MGTLRRVTPESSPQLGDRVPRADRGEGYVLPEAENTTNDFAPTDPRRILRAAPEVVDSSRRLRRINSICRQKDTATCQA